jgi:serine/threonine protein kinase
MKIIDKSAPPRESVASMASSSQATATRPRVGVAGEEDEQDDKIKSSTDREVGIMKLIQHPNILQLYDVYESTKSM